MQVVPLDSNRSQISKKVVGKRSHTNQQSNIKTCYKRTTETQKQGTNATKNTKMR